MEKKKFPHKITAASIAIFIVVCMAGSALAYMLAPSDKNPAEDSGWETILEELDGKALFEDIVADKNIDLENSAEFESALEQFLNIIAQNHKSTIEEQAIEALMVPVANGKISSPYGYRVHPITMERKLHSGIDYAQKAGADIVAANGGKVIATQDDLGNNGYGNYLIIVHNDGTACLYAHCSTLIADTGDWVNKGDKIAEIGRTGNATGPHCHFEFRINGKAVDPTPYIAVTE
ncbi:MAG: M23 family metallopeptidase [Bacillota bacterium]|nr:M23 family metallopeptidase [Bacillota bacterium]